MSENREEFEKSMEIDLVDFSANREMDRIRENERIEREKRRRRVEMERRAEIRRRRKMERIKQAVIAWSLLIVCVLAVIFLVVGVFSLFGGGKTESEKAPVAGDEISEFEISLLNEFKSSSDTVYGEGKAATLQSMAEQTVFSPDLNENPLTHTSEYSLFADTYYWNSGFGRIEDVKNYIRTCPISNMGYVYSSPAELSSGMKSHVTNGYLYDTQASFINAVYEICKWEGNSSFVDAAVLSKLESVAGYYMNKKDPNGGGIRYNFRYYTENGRLETEDTDDGLVYICTKDNLGTPEGNASNLFLSYKFGYLDCYNNLVFYEAMVSMSNIYDMKLRELESKETKTAEDEANIVKYTEKRDEYASFAEASKEAINNTFYDAEKGRYIGYINVDGQKYDYGFTAINLMAVSLGVADEEQKNSIMSWINGERRVESDTVTGTDISAGVLPLFSTVEVLGDSSWNTLGRYLRDSGFGSLWLYGGQSALCAYYNLETTKLYGRDNTSAFVSRLVGAYENGIFKVNEEPKDSDEPALYYALLTSAVLKEYFGISAENDTLVINPLFDHDENIGLKNIYFNKNHYDVLFDNSVLYLLCENRQAVKIKVGGFDPSATVKLTLVDSDCISSVKDLVSDEKGFVTVVEKFGDTSYIKLENK